MHGDEHTRRRPKHRGRRGERDDELERHDGQHARHKPIPHRPILKGGRVLGLGQRLGVVKWGRRGRGILLADEGGRGAGGAGSRGRHSLKARHRGGSSGGSAGRTVTAHGIAAARCAARATRAAAARAACRACSRLAGALCCAWRSLP